MAGPRRLLARLRETMAKGAASLAALVHLVSNELVAEVCSVYAMRPGDTLELVATEGLRQEAVGRTRLRVGEGIVGLVAATGEPLNLPDAQNHPAFAYRAETGEEPFASLLAVPVRRAGRLLGVLTVQNRQPRRYSEDEVEVVETVAMLLAEVLAASGVTDGAEEGLGVALPRTFRATTLAAGLAIGPVVVRGTGTVRGSMLAADPEVELGRLGRAADAMRRGLDALIEDRLPAGDVTREVLDATRMIAADAGWMRRVGAAIRGGLSAEAAVERVSGELRERMRRIVDPYLRERLADLEDLAARLLASLDDSHEPPAVPPGGILLARRLGPAQLLDWHARGIAGLALEEGSPSGHAAILARALGIPALGGARGMLEATVPNDDAILDAGEGRLILRPDAEVRQSYEGVLAARTARRAGWAKLRKQKSLTGDGHPVRLMLNVGLALELDQLEATGAEGIGLFRTEIAMLARGAIADAAEQAATYAAVLDAAAGRPVLFRTLDLGGDKLLPDAPPPREENPAMGWRSLRIGLDRPALMRRQLRALLLAAGGRKLTVMFPMVATVGEFRRARELLLHEAERVRPRPERLEIGSMVEVPSLLWQTDELMRQADFVSIGSNDLMQFLFAADRGAPDLAGRYDFLAPPVLDILDDLARRGAAAGVPVSVCGEAASNPLNSLVLVALGISTLSMSPSAILPVKAVLAAADLGRFRPVLARLRQGAGDTASLRDPIDVWAREHGLPL